MASRARPRWVWIAAAAVVVAAACTPPGQRTARRFFSSLRLAKPQPVAANPAAAPGSNANRQLQDAIGGMVSKKVNVVFDEPDQRAPSPSAAERIAGFAARLPRARHDSAVLSVIGARSVEMTVDRDELRTILMEAGQSAASLPASIQGAHLALRTPRAIRAQYGNCPVPVANTIQAQIQGPPPPSTDNGNCVVLVQSPRAAGDVPPGLEMDRLTEIALELAGMSPKQAHAFQSLVHWQSAVVLSLPRAMRSYDVVTVQGVPGMLMNTGGRRGPTWALIWEKDGTVYELTGYGSSADALPLANSVS
ncbi:MAG: putative transrane anti-sigma factor [Gemmatimonadetes bacterium]|nr:putative transrane anti-sigma factor [Gemmatimonadota bacterium]